jgi:lysozyme
MADLPQSSVAARAGPLGVILAACALVAAFTQAHEGTVLYAYRDPVGVLTACIGHTGPDVRIGAKYTPAQCQAMLQDDLVTRGVALAACVRRPLPLQTWEAFIDFAYNVGVGAFCGSTLAAKANAGDLMGACAQLSLWVYAGRNADGSPRKLPGLVTRRADERALCEAGVKAGLPVIPTAPASPAGAPTPKEANHV